MTPADTFRDVMAGVPTPVPVVTTQVDDRPHGTTVRAFASLSMAPPMLLAALDRRSKLLARLAIGQLTHHARTFGTHRAAETAA
jgi:flavin reductase (DIM6/NTAB) family NADH-FMN oxidoreductase RutF